MCECFCENTFYLDLPSCVVLSWNMMNKYLSAFELPSEWVPLASHFRPTCLPLRVGHKWDLNGTYVGRALKED